MAINIIRAATLHVSEPDPSWFGNGANEPKNATWTNANWLKSRFHFSFAEYHDSKRSGFGVLKVMNDDLVQPARGFGTHPHQDMEICTYIVNGYLTHQDSMGTKETLSRGGVQFMSAGSGIRHSEFNENAKSDLRFIQMWIVPRSRGGKPNYGGASVTEDKRKNVLCHYTSDVLNTAVQTPIKINQDANIYVSEIESGKSVTLDLAAGRQAYLLCMEGNVSVESGSGSGEALAMHDAAQLTGPASFKLSNTESATNHLLVVEMAHKH